MLGIGVNVAVSRERPAAGRAGRWAARRAQPRGDAGGAARGARAAARGRRGGPGGAARSATRCSAAGALGGGEGVGAGIDAGGALRAAGGRFAPTLAAGEVLLSVLRRRLSVCDETHARGNGNVTRIRGVGATECDETHTRAGTPAPTGSRG